MSEAEHKAARINAGEALALPVQYRAITMAAPEKPADKTDAAKRSFDLSFSSEDPYRRWFGTEILSHDPKNIRMDRMTSGSAPLLFNHDPDDMIGVVDKAWIDGAENCGRATVRCGMGELASEKYQDVQDGILRNVSVGYRVYHMTLVESDDETGDTYLVDDWEPLELSLVAVPADATVGVGRALDHPEFPVEIRRPAQIPETTPVKSPAEPELKETVRTMNEQSAAAPAVDVKPPDTRIDDILNLGKIYDVDTRLMLQENDKLTMDEAKAKVGDVVLKRAKTNQITTTESRMSTREKKEYSIRRAILAAVPSFGNCLEREVSEDLYKEFRGSVAGLGNGIMVPTQLRTVTGLDTLATGAGKETVATELLSLIEYLRKNLVSKQLGMRMLTGLQANIAIPRQSAITASSWLPFRQASTETFANFDQITMTPKRNTVATRYDIGFLRQSTLDAEAFVREDLGLGLAEGVDYAVFNGAGSGGVPEGVIPALGSGQKTAWDNTAAYSKIVAMQTALANANALKGALAYVATPSMRGFLKQTPKMANTIAMPIWDKDECDGYPAFASTNLPTNIGSGSPPVDHAFLLGDWSQVIMGEWGAIEIIVDPYTAASKGEYVVNASLLADISIRHVAAFNLMTGVTFS